MSWSWEWPRKSSMCSSVRPLYALPLWAPFGRGAGSQTSYTESVEIMMYSLVRPSERPSTQSRASAGSKQIKSTTTSHGGGSDADDDDAADGDKEQEEDALHSVEVAAEPRKYFTKSLRRSRSRVTRDTREPKASLVEPREITVTA